MAVACSQGCSLPPYAPQVCRQLAFWLAKDMTCFDVVSLAYALVTYVTVGGAMARASVAPRADGSRDAVGTSSALPPANQRLVRRRDHEPYQPSPSP